MMCWSSYGTVVCLCNAIVWWLYAIITSANVPVVLHLYVGMSGPSGMLLHVETGLPITHYSVLA